MGDSINARNQNAYNQFSGWQQQQQINGWNRNAQEGAANAIQRQKILRDYGQKTGGGSTGAPGATTGGPGQQSPVQEGQAGPNPLASYKTGFNAEDQAINSGNVIGRMRAESQYKPQGVTGDAARAIEDHRRGQLANDTAQMRRGMQLQNSQQYMKDQVARSELMQQGLANQSKIYNDLVQRDVSQIGLAASLQAAMLRSRMAFTQALMGMNT